MSENIALSNNKQKAFNRSVKKTKSKIKKGQIKITDKVPRRSLNKNLRKKTGFVYLSNIPHGFYEKQLLGYFSQFGNVIKVRVARSKKTGNSKGHAFIKFEQEDVAKIAAETMDNYLMGNRLLKAKLLPHDEKTRNLFKKPNFSKEHYPTKVRQLRFKKAFNARVSEEKITTKVKNSLKHIDKIIKKLKDAGIDYDFKPVHVPTIPGIKKEKQEIDADDSSSEDIVFTPPEEMYKRLKGENKVVTTPKKVKKLKSEKKKAKEDKKTKTKTSTKKITKKQEVTENGTNNTLKAKKVKKNKAQSINDNITPIKEKKNKTKSNENAKVESISEIMTLVKGKKNKIKKNEDATPEKLIKKKKQGNPKKQLNIVKKSKRASTISEKKANLMVELIKTNNQVKKVNKIEKKKNKTK